MASRGFIIKLIIFIATGLLLGCSFDLRIFGGDQESLSSAVSRDVRGGNFVSGGAVMSKTSTHGYLSQSKIGVSADQDSLVSPRGYRLHSSLHGASLVK